METICIENCNHQKEGPAKRGRASRLSSAQIKGYMEQYAALLCLGEEVIAKFDIAVMWDGVLLSISHSLSLGFSLEFFAFRH
jgi:hypothetical protein